jgi:Flp pilus assembly protein CpaB
LWITIRAAAPDPPVTAPVLVAAHDLPAGRTLTAADLRSASWPIRVTPSGGLGPAAAPALLGRMLAGPIRAGEPLTDTRVLGPGLLAGQPAGTVALPVRLGDPAAAAFVRAGDRVDVLVTAASTWATTTDPPLSSDGSTAPDGSTTPGNSAASGQSGSGSTSRDQPSSGANRLASGVLVLAVPGSGATSTGFDSGSGSSSSGSGSWDSAGSGNGGLGGLTGLGSGSDTGATTGSSATGIVVLAVTSDQAGRLAAAQNGNSVSLAVLPPG